MSQSLIIFRPSGKVEYQLNNKISPFNQYISGIVNESCIELEQDFFTQNIGQRRFYSYQRSGLYCAIYFDAITTIDSEKVKQTLAGMLKTFLKIEEEYDEEKSEGEAKLKKLVEVQFNQLMKLKQVEKVTPGEAGVKTANNTSSPSIGKDDAAVNSKKTSKSGKKMRTWGHDGGEVGDGSALDYSENKDGEAVAYDSEAMKIDKSAFVQQNDLVLVNELNDILGSDDDADSDDDEKSSGGFFSKISSYLGGNIDIEEVSKKFKNQLIAKNIAPQTAETIISRLKSKLSNKKGVKTSVYREALIEELTKILTPNVSTDLLQEIKSNSKNPRPYVISVVGVNGVGKSTNLAKLAYWLLQNKLNVLICACDTFRSGAVEQLKVHVNNLKGLNESSNSLSKIDIFEKGYGGGDHVVTTAKSAVQYAADENYDVVLIDTAGRTHSNAKLMAPLKKFGDAANPNKIIMVGEALVGSDSVEQAINFNNAFGNRRNLDFFIISKVDTVGDLVGAMINMIMATKVPILFVGTGQTYTDIKRLSVNRVVEMLMS